MIPPLPEGVSWEQLHQRYLAKLEGDGLLAPSLWAPCTRGVAVVLTYAALYGVLLTSPGWPVRLLCLAVLGAVVLQSGLIAHEVAHASVTKKAWLAEAFGQLFMTLLCGQAYGHWSAHHGAHHQVTQQPLDDPDMELDYFALSEADAVRKRGVGRFTTRWQGVMFWPLATLMAFSIRMNTWRWLHAHRSALDAVVSVIHLALWLVPPALVLGLETALVNFALLTWLTGPWLMMAFYWNHIGRAVVPVGERWPAFAQRLVTTRGLGSGWLTTYFFGGLNLHLEHHLAPTVPLRRLPQARRLLNDVLGPVGLRVPEWTWAGAMLEVHRHLVNVARHAGAVPPYASASSESDRESQPRRWL